MSEQQAVTEMFDDISSHYDFLNHLLSFGIDRRWRRIASKWVAQRHPSTILDVATGTADLAIRMAKDIPSASITGVDLSEKMLEYGRTKLIKKGLDQRITLVTGDATKLPFQDDSFDAVTSAFGVRNFEDLETGLREMVRVCHNGGLIAVLEFSHPTNALMKRLYRWYSRRWIPRIGRNVSKHPTAYNYLPSTVEAFPSGKAFEDILKQVGLIDLDRKVFSGGIATLYYGFTLKNSTSSQ